jgi:hypothetical protein
MARKPLVKKAIETAKSVAEEALERAKSVGEEALGEATKTAATVIAARSVEGLVEAADNLVKPTSLRQASISKQKARRKLAKRGVTEKTTPSKRTNKVVTGRQTKTAKKKPKKATKTK